MRYRTVIRKSAKWGGTVTALVLLTLWIATIWWGAVRIKQNGILVVGAGRIEFLYEPSGQPPPRQYDRWQTYGPGCEHRGMGRFSWGFDFKNLVPGWSFALPIWSLSLIAAFITAAGWRFDSVARRRVRAGLCPACGYNLAGLAPGANCPECGRSQGTSA